jgi:hypothetical protein
MKLSRKVPFVFFCWLIIAVHALALVAILFAAATARAHAALPTPSARTGHSEPCESPARPGCNPAPTGDFNAQRSTFNAQRSRSGTPSFSVKSSAFSVKSSGASAPACNPATAGARVSSGPVSLVFSPAKQNRAPHFAPTLPAVAG